MRFEIVQGDEQISSHSGLALVGAMLDRIGLRERLDEIVLGWSASIHKFDIAM
jgi:hypothetical protein